MEEDHWLEEDQYTDNSWKKKQILKGQQDPLAHLKCAMCPYVFRLEASLSAHIAFNHNNVYECSTCGDKFNNSVHLTRHRKVEHGGGRNNMVTRQRLDSPSEEGIQSFLLRKINTTNSKIIYQCKECDQEFRKGDILRKHVKRRQV